MINLLIYINEPCILSRVQILYNTGCAEWMDETHRGALCVCVVGTV